MTRRIQEQLRKEWIAILANRRKYGTCGQRGQDFDVWVRYRLSIIAPAQPELFKPVLSK